MRHNLVGQSFGKLTVIEYAGTVSIGQQKQKAASWLCHCECGKTSVVLAGNLKKGHTTSCGCLKPQLIDLTGKQFGYLTVIEYAGLFAVGTKQQTRSKWRCKCKCGTIIDVLDNSLKQGTTSSCGCYHKQRAFEANLSDLAGQRFGRLVVLRYQETRNGVAYWQCQCDCGNISAVSTSGLNSGGIKSCGCRQGNFIHGEWTKGAASYSRYKRQNPLVRLKHNVGVSIRSSIKSSGASKSQSSVFEYLPYNIQDLKDHLERLFEPWMNWNNYGGRSNDKRQTWHIDHLKPHCEFSYVSMTDQQFLECWALSNLRPLEKKANMSKGRKTA